MKNIPAHFLVLLTIGLFAPVTSVWAQDCASAANAAAAESGAEVLNVAALGNGKCEVTLRIPGKNGQPPRVVTQQVSG